MPNKSVTFAGGLPQSHSPSRLKMLQSPIVVARSIAQFLLFAMRSRESILVTFFYSFCSHKHHQSKVAAKMYANHGQLSSLALGCWAKLFLSLDWGMFFCMVWLVCLFF